MATHNGDRFLVEQLESILAEIGQEDELIIVDDCSADRTKEVIRSFNDPRIGFYVNHHFSL
jgi:glycosyltransferase involved in cell wall biosynthesis